MEQLISDIETYCAQMGISPQKLLREVINAKWGQWQDWKAGKSSPTVLTADKLRAFMTANLAGHANARGEVSPDIQGNAA